MRELVKHLWKQSGAEIIDNTIINCHAMGLHSIMLINKPGQRVRMFFAEEHHDLWSNNLQNGKAMTVGFHQHHCNIKIVPIFGEVVNLGFDVAEKHVQSYFMSDFQYESQILTGKQKFTFLTHRRIRLKTPKVLRAGDALELPANEYHTIYLQRDLPAAWFIFEGKEWPEYKAYCISDADLEKLPVSELMYQKLSSLCSGDYVVVNKMLNKAFDGI